MKPPIKEIVIAFVIGGLVGWFAATRSFECFEHRGPHGKKGQLIEKFSRELKLTPDQKVKVQAIFDTKRAQFKALREQSRPQFEEIQKTSRTEIEKVLTPDQIPAFRQMEEKWRSRRDHSRKIE